MPLVDVMLPAAVTSLAFHVPDVMVPTPVMEVFTTEEASVVPVMFAAATALAVAAVVAVSALPVKLPTKPVFAVIVVPVMAAAVVAPMTVLLRPVAVKEATRALFAAMPTVFAAGR